VHSGVLQGYVMATVALVGGPLLFLRGFKTVRTRRLIANTPTAKIRSMAMGLAEVKGVAEPRSVLSAPFSGKPCAYWEVEISSRSRNGWSVIHRNQSGHPFFVHDDTGVALVYPHGAEAKVPVRGEEECVGLSLPPCYADYMSAHTSALSQFSRMGRLRFRERLLEAGDPVYILGTAVPRSASQVIADGEVLQQAVNEDAGAARLRALDHDAVAVIRRGDNEPTFIISQESESDLMLQLGGKALLLVVAGPVLTLYGLAHWMLAMSAGLRP
jgi:hypothetical protein